MREWKFSNIIYISHLFWIKFCVGDVHKNVLSNGELCENWCSESYTLLLGINKFLSVPALFIVQLCGIWCKEILLLRIFKFHESWSSEDHVTLDRHKLNLCLYRETVWYFGSQECFGDICIVCGGVHSLQSCLLHRYFLNILGKIIDCCTRCSQN